MNNLKYYIQEKLRLNKDTNIYNHNNSNIKMLSELYKVGDKCLLVSTEGISFQARVLLAVVEVTRKLKIKFEVKYLFDLNGNRYRSATLKNETYNRNGIVCQEYLSLNKSILIPANECLDLLDIIRNNGYKFDFFDSKYTKTGIYTQPKENNLTAVKKLKNHAKYPPEFNDYEEITEDDLKELEKYL